jgi:hypothetical protein
MRHQGYVVKLSTQERGRLEDIIRKGKNPARLQTRARILCWEPRAVRAAAR